MLGAPHHHLLPCANCLPRHLLPQKPCHKNHFFESCIIRTPANRRGRVEWQISLKQSRGGFRTPGVGAQQLAFGEQYCLWWDWFASICLVWSSAVTMARHTAKRVLPLIAASSYVRVLLTGGIYDTDDKAAGLQLSDDTWKIRVNPESLSFVYTSHARNEEDTHESRNTSTSTFTVESSLETRVTQYKICPSLKLFSSNKLSFGGPKWSPAALWHSLRIFPPSYAKKCW